jgi:hypothetical protein
VLFGLWWGAPGTLKRIMYGAGRSRGGFFVTERDSRLERLIFLSAGVYAIALTLLAVDLHGRDLLESLLDS